jgi:hypothetical protein
MDPRHAAAAPAANRDGGETNTYDALNVTSHLRTAPGVWLPPSGRRAIGAWVVRCTWCGAQHLHRGERDGAVRRAGCGSGRRYVVTAR